MGDVSYELIAEEDVLCATGQRSRIVLKHGMGRRVRFRRDLQFVNGRYVRWHAKRVMPLRIDRKF